MRRLRSTRSVSESAVALRDPPMPHDPSQLASRSLAGLWGARQRPRSRRPLRVRAERLTTRRAQGAAGIHGRTAHDSVWGVEGVHHPTVSRVDAYVAGPPEDIARAHLGKGHLRQRRSNPVGRPGNRHARRTPRALDEPRAIEARWSHSAPAIALTDLRSGEPCDGRPAARGRWLVPRPRTRDERRRRSFARHRRRAPEEGKGKEGPKRTHAPLSRETEND
jgi:hypothetical protein